MGQVYIDLIVVRFRICSYIMIHTGHIEMNSTFSDLILAWHCVFLQGLSDEVYIGRQIH